MPAILTRHSFDTMTHPRLCEFSWCEAHLEFGYHRGAKHDVKGPLLGDVEISAQLKCAAWEPLGAAQISLDLAFRRYGADECDNHHVGECMTRTLISTLSALVPALTPAVSTR